MAQQNYIIELSDGRKLSFSPQDVQHYPTIANTVDNPLFDPDSAILLTYDPDVLYMIFTTPILQTQHTLDMYVRITNGLDYLENIATVKRMMATLVKWFYNPDIVAQFKINKENTKNLMHSLNFEPQGWLLDNTLYSKLNYMLNAPIPEDKYKKYRYEKYVAVSDNLSYVVIWYLPDSRAAQSPQVNIYKDGILIKTQDDLQLSQVSNKMVIDDNGTIYNSNNLENNVYIWHKPDYIPQLYKHIDGEAITLADNTQRYLQDVLNVFNIGGFAQYVIIYIVSDLHTGTVISRTIPYNPANPPQVAGPDIIRSSRMDLIIITYYYTTSDPATNVRTTGTNHGVWVVDNNTTAWIRFQSKILLISHSEQIIATADPQPEDTNKYNVAIYKRRGINFEPLANIDDIYGRPIVVNENFLITTTEGVPNIVQGIRIFSATTDINFHKITNQTIEREPINIINKDMIGVEIYPGPQNTYLFLSRATALEPHFIIKKYGIQPYDTMEEFLEDKLD